MSIANGAKLVLILAVALFCGLRKGASAQGTEKSPGPRSSVRVQVDYRGGLVNPPQAKPKFVLTDTSGARYDFWSKTNGHPTLLFFGYTHCPDMCPLQMSVIAHAFRSLPPDLASEFRVVFVTTDPDRDTPTVLRAWLDHFDRRFIGLTGNERDVDAAEIAANLPPAKKSPVRPDGAYEVGHAAFVLAYTRDNLAHVIYPVGVSEADWEHDLPALGEESWANKSAAP